VSDQEIQQIVSYICDQAPCQYLIESFDKLGSETLLSSEQSESGDSLYEEARSIVLETRNASTTFLQRKLKIGYARAASLMDELEARGIIGPQEGSKPRRILVDSPGSSAKRGESDEEDLFGN
jgi:S-DNA-T family DNA segregation ATPase FtsK/SpoIIIE